MTATRDATPTVRERAGDRRDSDEVVADSGDSPFDPPSARFEARGELGRGGMGRVTDAYDRALHRPVAIKEMLSASSLDLARFEREARITAKLEHPGIVPIHDAGRTADGTPFYVMRRIDGRPLDQLIDEESLDARLALIPNVLAACDAVAFAHARGVVHRDIKPTNILVGPFGETLVIDWGIARELATSEPSAAIGRSSDAKLTRAGTIAGTPGFMSPEQARGESVDARADVFALGATLFFVLAGQQPYGSASATEMVDLAGAGRDPDWKRLPRDVPPELRAIARKAMAVRSDERYADAGALATDLRRFITGNLVAAYDYGFVARLGLFVKRHRGAVAVAAISAAVLAAVAIVAVRRIVAERDQANAASDSARLAAGRLLVQHARTLADDDPVAAVIALRSVAPSPELSRAAWVAASAAFVHGIPFGYETVDGALVQISRDSKRALVGSYQQGSLTIIDLVARRSRVVTHECKSAAAAWLGPNHAVCLGESVRIVDLTTGAAHALSLIGAQLLGDRDSRVWLLAQDRRLYELDDPDAAPREIATGVAQVFATDDLDVALLQLDTRWELRIHGHVVPLPRVRPEGTAYVSQHRIAIYDHDVLHVWRIEGDKLVAPLEIPEALVMSAAVTDDAVYMFTPRGLNTVGDNGVVAVADSNLGQLIQTAHGCIQLVEDGSLRMRDELGWVRIERHASEMRHIDVSPDQRFLVGTTTGGETLVWDLRAILPSRILVPRTSSLVALHETTAWLLAPARGLVRVDLRTRAVDIVIDEVGAIISLIDPRDRWVGAGRGDGDMLVEDLVADRQIDIHDIAIPVNDGDGLTIERADGTIWRWQPGDLDLHRDGDFGGAAELMSSRDTWSVGLVGHDVVRVDGKHPGREHVPAPPKVDALQITESGRAWILADHRVWRWDVGAPILIRVPTVGPIDDISGDDDALMMTSPRSITVLRGDAMHMTPVQAGATIGLTKHAAVIRDDRSNIDVLDLASGASFTLPTSAVQEAVLISDSHVAAITGTTEDAQVLSVWNLAVPEQPLALQAWLATITNAQPTGANEVYVWPGL